MREERLPYYYEVLELRPSASNAEIKKAWLELVQVWHPDRFHHSSNLHRKAQARTPTTNQAYQTLRDPFARARYDAITRKAAASKPPSRPSPPPRPQPTPRPRQEFRGPQSLIILSRPGQPKIPVPAIQMLVDTNEHSPYDFRRLVRIAGTIRQTLPAGDYAIAEAPGLFCVERKSVTELYASTSDFLAGPRSGLRARRSGGAGWLGRGRFSCGGIIPCPCKRVTEGLVGLVDHLRAGFGFTVQG